MLREAFSCPGIWLGYLAVPVLALTQGCQDIAVVDIDVAMTVGPVLVDAGQGLDSTLEQMVEDGEIPDPDPSNWPDGLSVEFGEDNPVVAVSDPMLVDLNDSEQGGDQYRKYRNNIRSIVIQGMSVKVNRNTLNYDTGPLFVLLGKQGTSKQELAEVAELSQGIEAGRSSEQFLDIPLNEHQKNIISTYLELEKFLVGMKSRWTGTITKDSPKPGGEIEFEVKLSIKVAANPL